MGNQTLRRRVPVSRKRALLHEAGVGDSVEGKTRRKALTTDDECRYFREPFASQMELKRDQTRTKRRITYDCFHAVVSDGAVRCARGYLSHSIPLLTVLRGRSTAVCMKCADYDDGGEPCG